MHRCKLCLYPDTKPDLHFNEGVCSACRSYADRPTVDWKAREHTLRNILQLHGGRCIVPSSGGKDSHYQVLTLLEMGAKPLVVTASTCHLTPVGRANIDNLARYATTIEYTPNRTIRAKLNRFGLELVGDISWPEHAGIFSIPRRIAAELGYNLVFYGENPQHEYGGPLGAERALQMTQRWVSEFGGFLGLRPDDFVGRDGITTEDMEDYEPGNPDVDTYFLGQFIPWDSHRNADTAVKAGMVGYEGSPPCRACWWPYENLDNAQTGIHDHFMFRKYGYGRLAGQLSVDIRRGLISRQMALEIARERDGAFPMSYMGVLATEVIDRIGMAWGDFLACLDQHTNWQIFDKTDDPLHPRLKEGAWQ
jgi:hypothetical protein